MPQGLRQYQFDRVIAPVSIERFLDEYYERRPLVLHRDQPDYFSDLVSIEALDEFLAVRRPTQDRVFAVDARREISPDEYLLPDARIDPVRLYQLFADGATISFRQMQDHLPGLAVLCRAAERVFSCPFQTNLYFTPAHAQGFKTHHDTHDVFVMQVAGSKLWRFYEPVTPLPLPGQTFEQYAHRLGPVVEEFTLNAGDLFYCPRGFPHDANATNDLSLHITFGALVYTWADVMIEAMAGACLSDPAFRAALPVGFASGRATPAELETTFRGLVERFRQSAQFSPAIDLIGEKFVSGRKALVPGQRRNVLALDTVDLDSWVGSRPDLIYRCLETDDTVTLHCHAAEITLPVRAAASLAFALEAPRFRIRDLPGNLDDAGKLVLIRRLIREGLVRII